jgi:hypothetical protein
MSAMKKILPLASLAIAVVLANSEVAFGQG